MLNFVVSSKNRKFAKILTRENYQIFSIVIRNNLCYGCKAIIHILFSAGIHIRRQILTPKVGPRAERV